MIGFAFLGFLPQRAAVGLSVFSRSNRAAAIHSIFCSMR
jgi:hypothetical protein